MADRLFGPERLCELLVNLLDDSTAAVRERQSRCLSLLHLQREGDPGCRAVWQQADPRGSAAPGNVDWLLKRMWAPARLRVVLADVLDRSDAAEERRREDHDRVRRERIAAEARLSRFLDLVAEEIMSPREPVFAAKLAEARASIAALSETNAASRSRSAARQGGSTMPRSKGSVSAVAPKSLAPIPNCGAHTSGSSCRKSSSTTTKSASPGPGQRSRPAKPAR